MIYSLGLILNILYAASILSTSAGILAAQGGDFYAGKTISLSVGNAPGSNYDLNARLISPYLTKYIPGHPAVVVRNVPGAGGMSHANQLFNVGPKDGLEIGIIARTAPQLAVLGEAGPRFNPVDFNWIGSSSSYRNDAYLMFIRADLGISSVEALRASKRQLNFGAGGVGSSNLAFGNIASDVLDIKLNVIRGYTGSAPIMLAMQNGEIDAAVLGYSFMRAAHRDLIDNYRIVPLLQFSRLTRHPDLQNTPTAREIAKLDQDRALIELAEAPFFMALPFAVPPGVPAERVALLRKAFMELHLDTNYIAEAVKLDLDVSPIDGEAVQALIIRMSTTTPEVIERFKLIFSK